MPKLSLDGTMGPAGVLDGPDFSITHDLGTTVGTNLFHSFREFSIKTGESATFSGPDSISNVFSRVTGGNPSNINGLLRSTIPSAGFYFLNPNGVMFGPNATLDVNGSFHVSTADELHLTDGGVFSAVKPDPAKKLLTSAPPSAFGFLPPPGGKPASLIMNGATLKVQNERSLSVTAGDVQITGGKLIAPSGRVNVVSAASAGEVEFGTTDLNSKINVQSISQLGEVDLAQGAQIQVDGVQSGSVVIHAGNLRLIGAAITSQSLSGTAGKKIEYLPDRRLCDEGRGCYGRRGRFR